MQYCYRHGYDTWSVALRVNCRLGLGTVLVLISTYTFMAECNRILEKTACCIAALTVSATRYYWKNEREKGDWLVNVE